jgi:hypothetical protein
MKKYTIILLIIVLGFTNCSKDSTSEPVPVPVDKTANLKGTGDSAHDILSNDNFTKLQLEIVYAPGFRPSQQAMDDFVDFLKERTFKQDIEVMYRELPSSNEESFTLQEIAEFEEKNRTAYNNGQTLAIYIYFADAPSADDEEEEGLVTLGAVYRNTSMIVYEKTVRALAAQSNQISNADVESATLHHEFGHLFGLVNLGTASVNDHEDGEADNHCNVPGCLMGAELQFGDGIFGMLQSRASKGLVVAPGMDPECIMDLQANGGR